MRLSQHFGLNDPRLQSIAYPLTTVTSVTTDANVTLTPAQVTSGFLIRGPFASARTDVLPSAAALCEYIQGVMVGTSFELPVRVTGGTASLTITPGAGGTIAAGERAVTQAQTKFFLIVFTNVTPGSEAYVGYSLGSGTT